MLAFERPNRRWARAAEFDVYPLLDMFASSWLMVIYPLISSYKTFIDFIATPRKTGRSKENLKIQSIPIFQYIPILKIWPNLSSIHILFIFFGFLTATNPSTPSVAHPRGRRAGDLGDARRCFGRRSSGAAWRAEHQGFRSSVDDMCHMIFMWCNSINITCISESLSLYTIYIYLYKYNCVYKYIYIYLLYIYICICICPHRYIHLNM